MRCEHNDLPKHGGAGAPGRVQAPAELPIA